MSLLIKNGLILDIKPGASKVQRGDVLIEDDRISCVQESIEVTDGQRVIDARNMLVMPGLNIAHAHSWAQLSKGALNGGPLEIWILDNLAPPVGFTFTKHQLYLRTLLGAAEMIRSGVTTVWDDVTLTADNQDHILRAYLDSGMRAVVTAAMHDKPLHERTLFMKDALPPELIPPLQNEKLKSVDQWHEITQDIYQRWHGRDGRINFAVSFSWPQGCTDALMQMAAEFAQDHDLALITHVLETKAQQITGQVFYGKSIVQYLNDLGILSKQLAIVHGIWITDRDIQLLQENQVSVLHNPSSNLTLGSGIMPYRKLKQAGVNIALGVDEGYQSKWNPFEMMRLGALMHKISGSDFRSWPTAVEILEDAIIGGARSELLYPEVGALTPGCKADLLLLELDPFQFSDLDGIMHQLVYCETGNSVNTSIINGQIVMQDHRILLFDEDALFEEVNATMTEYRRVNLENNNLALAHSVKPYVENIYRQSLAIPTGINRWIGNEKEWIDKLD